MANYERLELQNLKIGDTVRLTAGEEPRAYTYDLLVFEFEDGEYPLCSLVQVGPDFKVVGPADVKLEGTGQWTTRKQNPAQQQLHKALTIGYGTLRIGRTAVTIIPGTRNRMELLPEVTKIEVIEKTK